MLLRRIVVSRSFYRFTQSSAVEDLIEDTFPQPENKKLKAAENFSNPTHLFTKASRELYIVEPNMNFVTKLENPEEYQAIMRRRGICVPENYMSDLKDSYRKWLERMVEAQKLSGYISDPGTDKNSDEFARKSKAHREAHKILRSLHQAAYDCLNLPNELLPETPDHPRILSQFASVAGSSTEIPSEFTHLETLESLKLLRKGSFPSTVSLAGDAERLRHTLLNYCSKHLREEGGFQIVSPPHMVRPAIVQGCLLDKSLAFSSPIYPSTELPTVSNPLQLVGISLPSLLAMFTRKSFGSTMKFPLKFFALGSAYAGPQSAAPQTLFDTQQFSCAHAVIFEKSQSAALMEFGKLKIILQNLLEFLKIRCCTVQLSAPELSRSEMSRISFRYGSDGNGPELASISFYGTFISERLQIDAGKDHSKLDLENPANICSSNLNIHALIAAIVEDYGWNPQNGNNYNRIPFVLKM